MIIIVFGLIVGGGILVIIRQIIIESFDRQSGSKIRFGAVLYILSLGLLVVYAAGIFLLSVIADSDQFIYLNRTRPLWFLYAAGGGMVISSLMLILTGIFERGLVLMVFPVLMLVTLILIAPIISYLSGENAPLASLRHADHLYFVAPMARDSGYDVHLVECGALGLICRKLDGENMPTFGIGYDRENIPDRLAFDPAQNVIVWLRDNEIIWIHALAQ